MYADYPMKQLDIGELAEVTYLPLDRKLNSKGNYTKDKNALVKVLLAHDFTITDRRYIGYETETGYHHYAVDVAQYYEMEE